MNKREVLQCGGFHWAVGVTWQHGDADWKMTGEPLWSALKLVVLLGAITSAKAQTGAWQGKYKRTADTSILAQWQRNPLVSQVVTSELDCLVLCSRRKCCFSVIMQPTANASFSCSTCNIAYKTAYYVTEVGTTYYIKYPTQGAYRILTFFFPHTIW
jgi:hypothetical protein